MRLLLTGAAGSVGQAVLLYLLEQDHYIISIDIQPLPESLTSSIPGKFKHNHFTFDLSDYHRLETIFKDHGPFDGVIHLSAIPTPLYDDPRIVHNNNVTSNYNVLKTAVDYGVKRIVQASSVNAPGLSYTPEGRQYFDNLPMRESDPYKPMDAYALSKQINEIQAECICRTYPDVRIASLRFHMVTPDIATATPKSRPQDMFAWTSHQSAAEACLLGITSTGWEGAEAFNIVGPQTIWVGGESQSIPDFSEKGEISSLDLLEAAWKGRYNEKGLDKDWWRDNPRRSFWDSTKAEKMLGWKHDY